MTNYVLLDSVESEPGVLKMIVKNTSGDTEELFIEICDEDVRWGLSYVVGDINLHHIRKKENGK